MTTEFLGKIPLLFFFFVEMPSAIRMPARKVLLRDNEQLLSYVEFLAKKKKYMKSEVGKFVDVMQYLSLLNIYLFGNIKTERDLSTANNKEKQCFSFFLYTVRKKIVCWFKNKKKIKFTIKNV